MGITSIVKLLTKELKSSELKPLKKVLNKKSKPINLKIFKSKPKPVDTSASIKKETISYLKRNYFKDNPEALAQNFLQKRQKLVTEMSNVVDKQTLLKIERASTPEELSKVLNEYESSIFGESVGNTIDFGLINLDTGKVAKKSVPLVFEQNMRALSVKRANFVLAREKALYTQSRNPQVIAIENILKEQYGCKFVSLKDDVDMAKRILQAFEIAKKNKVKLPKNVAISDFMLADAAGENLKGTLLFNRNQSDFPSGFMSTNSECHIPLHEIMHGEGVDLVSFSYKQIPKEMMPIKNSLSGYSSSAPTHETFTELNTKRLIDGLDSQEQKLYDYLNFLS